MDILNGNILHYLIPIVMIILFSLPDVLRKKRKYPKRQPTPQKKPEVQHADTDKALPAQKPVNQAQAEKKAAPAISAAVEQENALASPLPKARPAVTARLTVQKAEPWSGLSSEARELYAGFIWEELLQPPLARRRNRQRYMGGTAKNKN